MSLVVSLKFSTNKQFFSEVSSLSWNLHKFFQQVTPISIFLKLFWQFRVSQASDLNRCRSRNLVRRTQTHNHTFQQVENACISLGQTLGPAFLCRQNASRRIFHLPPPPPKRNSLMCWEFPLGSTPGAPYIPGAWRLLPGSRPGFCPWDWASWMPSQFSPMRIKGIPFGPITAQEPQKSLD